MVWSISLIFNFWSNLNKNRIEINKNTKNVILYLALKSEKKINKIEHRQKIIKLLLSPVKYIVDKDSK